MNVQVGDIRSLSFENCTYDLVISISTLDHFVSLDEIQTAIEEVARVVKPGGRLIITLDNPANPIVWLRNILPSGALIKSKLIPYETGVTCKPDTLRKLCVGASLEVIEMTAVLHCPRVLAVATSRLFERRFGASKVSRYFLEFLGKFETMERWPTKYLTGHFTAIHLQKPL